MKGQRFCFSDQKYFSLKNVKIKSQFNDEERCRKFAAWQCIKYFSLENLDPYQSMQENIKQKNTLRTLNTFKF